MPASRFWTIGEGCRGRGPQVIHNNLINKGEIAGRNTCTCVSQSCKTNVHTFFGDDLTLILKSIPDDGSLPSAGHLHVVTPHIEMLWQWLHHDLAHSDHTCQVCRRGTWHPCRNIFLRLQGPSLKIHVICGPGYDRVCLVWCRISVHVSVFASHFMAFVCNLAGSIRD